MRKIQRPVESTTASRLFYGFDSGTGTPSNSPCQGIETPGTGKNLISPFLRKTTEDHIWGLVGCNWLVGWLVGGWVGRLVGWSSTVVLTPDGSCR